MEQQLPLERASEWRPLPPPLAAATEEWIGVPISLIPLSAEADFCDVSIPSAVVAVARSGHGQRWYSSGTRRGRLSTAPHMVEIVEAGMYFDRFQVRGEPGEVVQVNLPLGSLTRWLHDSSHSFSLRTQHEIFDSRLENLLNLMWDEASRGSPHGPLFSEGLTMALLGVLLADYSDAPSLRRARGRKFSSEQCRRLLDFIGSELEGGLSVEAMSKVLGMSPFHFSRIFRQTFHQTPHAFVVERRIDAACTAMRSDPTRTLTEIALTFGFSSQAHFSETFRRKVGIAPGRWRNSSA